MYRAVGLQVLPARYPMKTKSDKRPGLEKWGEFHNELTSDAVFARWYGLEGEKRNIPNMGAVTGAASGNIGVIDLDDHTSADADWWWRGLLELNNLSGEIETVEQRTGGGGRQKLFRFPAEWHIPTNRTSIGVDIRGQGGWAMLPPSIHMSGQEYTWAAGSAPWEIEIAAAPQWLMDAIDDLVEQNGGDKGAAERGEKTESPASDFSPFGARIDGRESAMADHVWACIVQMRRETGENLDEAVAERHYARGLDSWLRKAKTRLSGVDNAVGLERECRGATMFLAKWQRAMRKWTGKVADDAKADRQRQTADPPPGVAADEFSDQPLILSASAFVAGFSPPEYLIDGMLQRGYLYSLTARTGHGKTAVSMFLAQAICRGEKIQRKSVLKGSVLMLAGENPDDIRARFIVLADNQRFDASAVPIHFIAGIVNIADSMERIRKEVEAIPDLRLVIVDTTAAYFRGDDGNSNAQMGEYARVLRGLTFLPGKPAVVANSHPVKNAAKDNLLPAGGGAFLNEVDGNLTLWSGSERQTTLHWQGKFRGPEFEPITFRLDTVTCDRVVDANGLLMPSVVAVPISEHELERGERDQISDENVLLAIIGHNPNASMADLARKANWLTPAGEPLKSKVFRTGQRLREEKFVEVVRGKFRLLTKGRKEIGWDDE